MNSSTRLVASAPSCPRVKQARHWGRWLWSGGAIALGLWGSVAAGPAINLAVAQTSSQPQNAPWGQAPNAPHPGPPAPVERLTEILIEQRFNQLTSAILDQNVDQIVQLYAPNAKIEATVDIDGLGPQTIRLNGRQQLRDLLEMAYPQMTITGIIAYGQQVLVAPSQTTATLTCELVQTARANGQQLRTRSLQKMTFGIVDGAIVIIEDISRELPPDPPDGPSQPGPGF
ncbi:MAG: nuclear transport factor 2 family protein [Oscillatoriales cyanobacterium]|nr:MAG: nuclear transport factor 2 family protein [Oscillatoriales cyanobacterium]